MATYAELSDLVTDATFQKRIRFALLKAAFDISNEDPATTDHFDRLNWARDVLDNKAAIDLGHVALGVVLNPSIGDAGSAAPDADIQFQVNSMISDLVGG